MKDDNYKMAASPTRPGRNTLLQQENSDPFIDTEMNTDFFALPGLPFDDDTFYTTTVDQRDSRYGDIHKPRLPRERGREGINIVIF